MKVIVTLLNQSGSPLPVSSKEFELPVKSDQEPESVSLPFDIPPSRETIGAIRYESKGVEFIKPFKFPVDLSFADGLDILTPPRILVELQAAFSQDCPECWGTGLRSGFQAPCSRGCNMVDS